MLPCSLSWRSQRRCCASRSGCAPAAGRSCRCAGRGATAPTALARARRPAPRSWWRGDLAAAVGGLQQVPDDRFGVAVAGRRVEHGAGLCQQQRHDLGQRCALGGCRRHRRCVRCPCRSPAAVRRWPGWRAAGARPLPRGAAGPRQAAAQGGGEAGAEAEEAAAVDGHGLPLARRRCSDHSGCRQASKPGRAGGSGSTLDCQTGYPVEQSRSRTRRGRHHPAGRTEREMDGILPAVRSPAAPATTAVGAPGQRPGPRGGPGRDTDPHARRAVRRDRLRQPAVPRQRGTVGHHGPDERRQPRPRCFRHGRRLRRWC